MIDDENDYEPVNVDDVIKEFIDNVEQELDELTERIDVEVYQLRKYLDVLECEKALLENRIRKLEDVTIVDVIKKWIRKIIH